MIEYLDLNGTHKDQSNSILKCHSVLCYLEWSHYNNCLRYVCKPCLYSVMLNLKGAEKNTQSVTEQYYLLNLN